MPKKLPPVPEKSRLKMRKTLSIKGLLGIVRKSFSQIKDTRSNTVEYSLRDSLMSGLAIFGLKYESLLQFDKNKNEKIIRENLKNLYKVKKAPSDSQLRTILDPINPQELRGTFKEIHKQLQRQKILEEFKYLGTHLVSVDGSGQFSSSKISCQECCQKRRRNGEINYYHQLLSAAFVNPGKKNVLPLFPESITQQDGETKNDCELNASKRLLRLIRKDFPKLDITIIQDSLFSNAPHIRLLEELSFNYILTAKASNHPYLFDLLESHKISNTANYLEVKEGKVQRRYYYLNNVSLNASNPDCKVNWFEYEELVDGKRVFYNTWVTNIFIEEGNIFYLTKAGRARWKIENETFNTLKNQGYHLEHNYGHGKQHLATIFAGLMMLHFFIDQVQEMACSFFKAARNRFHSRKQLWYTMQSRFLEHVFPSWEALFNSMIFGIIPQVIQLDTS